MKRFRLWPTRRFVSLSPSSMPCLDQSVRPSVWRPEPALNWPLDYNMRRLRRLRPSCCCESSLDQDWSHSPSPISAWRGEARRGGWPHSLREGGRIRWTRMELRQKCDERRTDERTMHGASLEESLSLLPARNAIHFSDDDLMCNATEK